MAQLPSQDSRLSTLSTSQQPGRFPGAEKRQRATAASRTWAPLSHSLPRALRLRQPPVRARDRPGRTAPARTNQRPDANGLMELSSIPGCDQNSHPASPSPPAEGTNHQRTNPARDGNRAASCRSGRRAPGDGPSGAGMTPTWRQAGSAEPASCRARFLRNHPLLGARGRPAWLRPPRGGAWTPPRSTLAI